MFLYETIFVKVSNLIINYKALSYINKYAITDI
nr:hypothetical protein [Mucilaginibacter sp. E4BP6]